MLLFLCYQAAYSQNIIINGIYNSSFESGSILLDNKISTSLKSFEIYNPNIPIEKYMSLNYKSQHILSLFNTERYYKDKLVIYTFSQTRDIYTCYFVSSSEDVLIFIYINDYLDFNTHKPYINANIKMRTKNEIAADFDYILGTEFKIENLYLTSIQQICKNYIIDSKK